MEKFNNILFIINPNSGLKLFPNLDQRIERKLNSLSIKNTIIKTEYAGHASEISKEIAESDQKYDAIVAVGGDGTINEVIHGIGKSGHPFGIIPTGSGNGLARHLGISLFPMIALHTIIQGHIQPIDLLKIGKSKYGANVVGVGFDALVSWRFKESKTRGPISYVKIIVEEFLNFKSNHYSIKIDDMEMEIESPMITIANSSQFGNNALIAPKASLTDGLLDLCIIKPFPKVMALDIATKIMTGQIDNSKYYEHLQGKKIVIAQNKAIYQIDGESVKEKKRIKVKMIPKALNMIIPKKSIGKI